MSFAIDSHRENNPYFDYLETEDLVKNNYVQASEWEWQIDPEGLRYALNWFTDHIICHYLLLKMVSVL